jgi:HEAT repeat protein
LDLPYYVSWLRGYVVTQDDFRDIFINFAVNIHFLLIDALAGIGRLSPENLMAALRHQNLNVRMAALAALGKTGHPAAVELLVPFLDSNDLEERISAIVALGELRNKAVTDKVITSLKDENPVVRERAIRALMQINDTEALPALEDLARTDDTVIDDRPIITMKNLAEEAITIIRKNNPVTAKRISR